MKSLFGDDFDEIEVPSTQEIAKRVSQKTANPKQLNVEKALKSNKVSITEKLSLITENVNRILGRYADNTIVIKNKKDLIDYIDKSISNGIIAIDTETNNSLDPITCKLMGGCIYTPGEKNAYIPINHTDLYGYKLEDQLTEEDLREQFSRLSDTKIIMHNGKFDYEVIKCTCNIALDCYWDTYIAAKILDENERAGLKQQYINKIDSSVEKYSIDHLFEGVQYAVVDPDIFALYAATDAYMTYKLYLWQVEQFKNPDYARLFSLFRNVEMPVMNVIAEMELAGVCLDLEYSKRLSNKYHRLSDDVEHDIEEELNTLKPMISAWRLTPEANKHKMTAQQKRGKSANEQLSDPVEVSSNTQLAILLYDILGVEPPNREKPRSVGEDELTAISEKYPNITICKLILKKRGIDKLISTYIDKLPECLSTKDHKVHAGFNQFGADTGRLSSSNPNLQNIPSHETAIRMMFVPSVEEQQKDVVDNVLTLHKSDEVQISSNEYVTPDKLNIGDTIITDEGNATIINISTNNDYYDLILELRG